MKNPKMSLEFPEMIEYEEDRPVSISDLSSKFQDTELSVLISQFMQLKSIVKSLTSPTDTAACMRLYETEINDILGDMNNTASITTRHRFHFHSFLNPEQMKAQLNYRLKG